MAMTGVEVGSALLEPALQADNRKKASVVRVAWGFKVGDSYEGLFCGDREQ